jgi:hypothetical protein
VERVRPHYGGGSILNVVSEISEHFGVPTGHPPARNLPLDGAASVVLFIVDGLGYRQLMWHLEAGDMPELGRMLERGEMRLAEATSVFPSTTAAALTTLHTAAPPSETGMLGYNLWLPEAGAVSDMISFRNLERGEPLPLTGCLMRVPSLYGRLSEAGIRCRAVNAAGFRNTALTRWHFAGAEYIPYGSLREIPPLTARCAAEPGYTVAYWPEYDRTCHLHGPRGSRARDEIRAVDRAIGELFRSLPQNTALVITADHGQRELSPRKAVLLNGDPYFTRQITAPPAGERTARYLYVLDGAEAGIARHLQKAAEIMPAAEAWSSGLFGGPPAREDFYRRTGDLLAVTRPGWQLNWAFYPGQRKDVHRGGHGGWTAEEMLVPVLAARP